MSRVDSVFFALWGSAIVGIAAAVVLVSVLLFTGTIGPAEPGHGYRLIDLITGDVRFSSPCPIQWYARIPDGQVVRPTIGGTTYADGWLVLSAQGSYMTTRDEGYEAPPLCGIAYEEGN